MRLVSIEQRSAFSLRFLLGPVVGHQPLDIVGHGPAIGLAVLLRIDQRAEFDQVGDRVDVDGVGLAAQPQRLQRNRPAAGERVQTFGASPSASGCRNLWAAAISFRAARCTRGCSSSPSGPDT